PPHGPFCRQFQTVAETVSDTDAVVLCTDWDEYKQLDWMTIKRLMKQPYILDGRNMVDKGKVEALGFHYTGIANY
ncbi:UDP-glucose/GDP-mannose dehydrogenase family protein, partial [Alkalihalophilus lindianensis]